MTKSLKECGVTIIHLKEVTGRAIEEARPVQSCTKQLLLQWCNCIHTLKSTTVDLKKKRTNTADIEEAQHGPATHTHTHTHTHSLSLSNNPSPTSVPARAVGPRSWTTVQVIYIAQQSELAW
jgi:hypothetical protein